MGVLERFVSSNPVHFRVKGRNRMDHDKGVLKASDFIADFHA